MRVYLTGTRGPHCLVFYYLLPAVLSKVVYETKMDVVHVVLCEFWSLCKADNTTRATFTLGLICSFTKHSAREIIQDHMMWSTCTC